MLKLPNYSWKKGLLILIASLGASVSLNTAIAETSESSAVIAALALNFARFTEWPEQALSANDKSVKMCVLGDNVTQQAFENINQKQVGTRSLDVIHLTRIKNLENCHLLYVSSEDRGTTIQLLSEIRKRHILTIGEDKHFLQDGGMILLTLVEGKVNIEIKLATVKQTGLQINSRVLKLATIVE